MDLFTAVENGAYKAVMEFLSNPEYKNEKIQIVIENAIQKVFEEKTGFFSSPPISLVVNQGEKIPTLFKEPQSRNSSMSVVKGLIKNWKYFKTKDLIKETGFSRNIIGYSLNRLRRSKEIKSTGFGKYKVLKQV